MDGLLEYYETPYSGKDYSSILAVQSVDDSIIKDCVYCNHCLPCPQDIDIALINKFYDEARFNLTTELKDEYLLITPNASDCIECEDCINRCPFNIDVIDKIRKTVELFN